MTDIPFDTFADWNGRCPDCGCGDWIDGPRGGLSQNVTCMGCGTRLNVVRNHDRYPGLSIAQRLPPRVTE